MWLMKIHVHRYVRYLGEPIYPVCSAWDSERRRSAAPCQFHQGTKFNARVEFVQWIQLQAEHPDFLHRVLWSDEGTFSRGGIVNKYNERHWAFQNAYVIRQSGFLVRQQINEWASKIHNSHRSLLPTGQAACTNIPYRLGWRVSTPVGRRPLTILPSNVAWIEWSTDGSWKDCTMMLECNISRSTGCDGPVPHPTRSPDLYSLNFLLWWHFKAAAYSVVTNRTTYSTWQHGCGIVKTSRFAE
jgi:hypothetical protein